MTLNTRAVARIVVTPALAFVLLAAGCQPESGSTQRRPGPAGAAQPPAGGAPEADRPGPQADPGQCVQAAEVLSLHGREKTVELIVNWISDRDERPAITYTIDGDTVPATNLHTGRASGGGWSGEWSRLVNVRCGQHVAVHAAVQGDGTHYVQLTCSILEDGQWHRDPWHSGKIGADAPACGVAIVVS